MDPVATFAAIESLYARVLELAREPERCLRTGTLAGLQALLLTKDGALALPRPATGTRSATSR